jgi:hypothetical protein
MNEIKWPPWVGRGEQIALDAVVRLIDGVQRGGRFNTQLRDVIREVGFRERNSVGALSDLIEKTIRERVNS